MRSPNAANDWKTPDRACATEGIGNNVATLKSRLAIPRNPQREAAVQRSDICEHSLRGTTTHVHTETYT